MYLEEMLSFELFFKSYKSLKEGGDDVEVEGPKSKYIPLVFQLIVCEDKIYS